jgi:hypothetical protein
LAPPRQVRRRSEVSEAGESRLEEVVAEVPAINMVKD